MIICTYGLRVRMDYVYVMNMMYEIIPMYYMYVMNTMYEIIPMDYVYGDCMVGNIDEECLL